MPSTRGNTGTAAVEAYLAGLDHPRLDDIRALRRLILETDPAIGEAIKWNAPSFHLGEHFATMRLNGKPPLQLILHLGAKNRQPLPAGAIADPAGLLKWLGPDRACIDFAEPGSVEAWRDRLQAILRQWMVHVR